MYPAALGARALVAMYLQGMIFRTLAQAVPDRVIAETGTPPHLSAYMGLGNGGRRYVDIMFLNGGLGARPTMDGVSSIGWPANIAGIPVEVTENEKPLLFLAKELVTDSGGSGRQRGGLAARLEVRSEAREPSTVGVRLDRITHPALGLLGGQSGGTASVSVNGQPVHSKKTITLARGDTFAVRCAEVPAMAIRTNARREPSCEMSKAAMFPPKLLATPTGWLSLRQATPSISRAHGGFASAADRCVCWWQLNSSGGFEVASRHGHRALR